MKQLRTFLFVSLTFFAFAFTSCMSDGTDANNNNNATDTTAAVTPPVETKQVAMVVSHHVKDYAAFRVVFDKNAPLRDTAGLKLWGVYQDVADPNYVSVSLAVTDVEAARKFAGSEELATAMKEAGVTDQPEVRFYENQFMDEAAAASSDNRMFIVLQAPDYHAFTTVFAENDSLRKARGVSAVFYSRNIDDLNEVVIGLTAADMATLKAHAESPEVKAATVKVDIAGKPMIHFATKVKETAAM